MARKGYRRPGQGRSRRDGDDGGREEGAAAGARVGPGIGTAPAGEAHCFLAVCGHANLDVHLVVPDLPTPGASTPVRERRTVRGGTGCNIARHAAGLGVPTRLWARVGADFPADWRKDMEADGVDLSHLVVDPDGATPTCYVLTDAERRQSYLMDQGAMATAAHHPPPASLLEGVSGWLHIATGPPAAYGDLAAAARERDLPVALDPGQELRFVYTARTFERLLDRSDVLFLNAVELDVALRYLSYGDPVQLLDHVETLVVTHGPDGAVLYHGKGKRLRMPAVPVRQVADPTGAGDALRAGWYAALHQGKDRETALRWGQAASAVKVQHAGAQDHVVRRKEMDALLARS